MKNFWIGLIVFWSFFLVGSYFLAKHFSDSPKFEGTSGQIIIEPIPSQPQSFILNSDYEYTFLNFMNGVFESCETMVNDAKNNGAIARAVTFQTDNGYKEILCKDFLAFLATVPEVKK